jgi:Asp-tRNA(Asn)/Glu-tRNA(Gln) amidotransferase A subunit family amidase
MIERYERPAAELIARLQRREISAHDVVQASFEQIDRIEPWLHAWVLLDRDGALRAAGELDERSARGAVLPLHGLAFGVKDIIDVEGLPTEAGFPPYRQRIARRDSAIVARLRALGAIPLGKTHTTQFAFSDPAPTVNPYDPSRTPGGSSSGSGAAVGAHTLPLALGTQTAGSVLRPAAYCGAVGFKPTFNWFTRDGVLPLAWSLDHLGLLTQTARDAAMVYGALVGDPSATATQIAPPRIAFIDEFGERSEPEVAAHLNDVRAWLSDAGAEVVNIRLPFDLDLLLAVHHLIMQVEVAEVHRAQVVGLRDAYGPAIPAEVDSGALIPAIYDQKARRLRGALGRQVDALFDTYDALVLPTASNVAPPRALGSTGDRTFQAPWSLLGTPAITLPTGVGADGLPIGTQLIGRRGADAALLRLAAWAETSLGLIAPPVFA